MAFFQKKTIQAFVEAAERGAIKRAIGKVIDTRSYYPMLGNPSVKGFEQIISKKLGGVPVLGMDSGTSALITALKVFGIGLGDEVIVPAFSFIATAAPVSWVGATPVFVDVCFDDFSLDPGEIEGKITKRTKAIIVAHLFGRPAIHIGKILEIARKHSLLVIEDVAQSFGARIRLDGEWKQAGTLGDVGCFSFSSTKPFSAPGNAGAIVFCEKDRHYEMANKIRTYGENTLHYDHPVIGINNVLQDVQAAALIAKFTFLEHWLDHRKKLAQFYTEQLKDIPDLVLPKTPENVENVWYRYVARTSKRDALLEHLSRMAGKNRRLRPILCYPVLLPYFSAFGQKPVVGDFPKGEKIVSEVIPFPLYNITTMEDAARVVQAVKEFFRG